MKFAELKAAAEAAVAANDVVELFKVAKMSNEKLYDNINRAKLMSYTHGRAAEAAHYFQNVIPEWAEINGDIHLMLAKALEGKPLEEFVAIINAANGE